MQKDLFQALRLIGSQQILVISLCTYWRSGPAQHAYMAIHKPMLCITSWRLTLHKITH